MKKEMKRTARLWMLFAVITLLVVGCTDDNINPTTPEEPDEERMRMVIVLLRSFLNNPSTIRILQQVLSLSIACCTIRGLSTLPYCTPTAIPSRHRKKQR